MNIKNTSVKPLFIGGKVIKPAEKASLGDEFADNAVIAKYLGNGVLKKI